MKKSQSILQFVKFGVVGGSGVLVNTGLLFFLKEMLSLDYKISSLIAIECAIINNFYWNFHWTWQDQKTSSHNQFVITFLKFNTSSGLTAYLVNWGLLVLLTERFGLYYQISNLIGISFGTLVNFLVSKYWTFNNTSKVNDRAKKEKKQSN